ncbi:MAG: endonuclease/exonuclease/phosphatase family protein [Hoeflea sp.]|uniref:endonuclease/exonuclease/phosphatase family protein n=1 Tax=Hoeflea sp. TaxID=1940281 RepID=UPI001D8C73FD|nr:endonuclease/exonuclease/phosphatase family protein [Hoeflea sp.]MBU4530738.1 endonuclease/exonuclease/phosphatase family protein [Alphaproteobacteria bacterium]MBU4544737.1 endonuclease/exonuclease/phosphatase family protein [Alphaproteobacteria bacterium]MBU4549293.1 endonuclease/exonuclease/phosphatase family protein [Alphaproteobacteria bacterium]MBV1726332.1 endonuclease/exonuclease/phosphatase family protein [Hoeflea sp.]MBV1761674.1 endonuclease/exonuclease/phosphatase family protein
MHILQRLLIGLGGLAIFLTVLPIIPSDEAFIRIWDFPRTQVATVLVVALGASMYLLPLRRIPSVVYVSALTGALVWQAYAIWPYTPLHEPQAKALAACEPESRLSLMVANVLVENRNAAPLLALVDRLGPDLVLLVETNNWWDAKLEPLKNSFPHIISHPQEDSYGLHLFSRFELISPQVRFLIDDYVPSIKTGIRLPSGALTTFYGLHPKPPPLHDTDQRDAELLIVGKEIRSEAIPSVVAGDLNDVAWSQTNGLFQEVSGLLDPRIGRGLYTTFNADWPLLKWPLDHVFFEQSFRLLEIDVLEDVGSDHFPLFVSLCHDPASAEVQQQPVPEPSDLNKAEEMIEDGRDEASE